MTSFPVAKMLRVVDSVVVAKVFFHEEVEEEIDSLVSLASELAVVDTAGKGELLKYDSERVSFNDSTMCDFVVVSIELTEVKDVLVVSSTVVDCVVKWEKEEEVGEKRDERIEEEGEDDVIDESICVNWLVPLLLLRELPV